MTFDVSVFRLFMDASTVVQLVMLVLLLVSVVSWTLIFVKQRELSTARRAADTFEQRFGSGIDVSTLYNELVNKRTDSSGIETIFRAGYTEYARARTQPNRDVATLQDSARRAMQIAQSREIDKLDERLPVLATVGSTSPYVGLFGTVWGIMNAFRSLGNVQQATLALVAPGIAEALVATAMGLFAAIPAVIAYNRYATTLERLNLRYERFIEGFVNLLQRDAYTLEATSTPDSVSGKAAQ